ADRAVVVARAVDVDGPDERALLDVHLAGHAQAGDVAIAVQREVTGGRRRPTAGAQTTAVEHLEAAAQALQQRYEAVDDGQVGARDDAAALARRADRAQRQQRVRRPDERQDLVARVVARVGDRRVLEEAPQRDRDAAADIGVERVVADAGDYDR